MKQIRKWDWRCVMFGHVWVKKNGKWVCKRCGTPQ